MGCLTARASVLWHLFMIIIVFCVNKYATFVPTDFADSFWRFQHCWMRLLGCMCTLWAEAVLLVLEVCYTGVVYF